MKRSSNVTLTSNYKDLTLNHSEIIMKAKEALSLTVNKDINISIYMKQFHGMVLSISIIY